MACPLRVEGCKLHVMPAMRGRHNLLQAEGFTVGWENVPTGTQAKLQAEYVDLSGHMLLTPVMPVFRCVCDGTRNHTYSLQASGL